MIRITHIMYAKKAIGIAERKLQDGVNDFKITVKDKNGQLSYPHVYSINKEEAFKKYGRKIVNQNCLFGVWVPLTDLESMRK